MNIDITGFFEAKFYRKYTFLKKPKGLSEAG